MYTRVQNNHSVSLWWYTTVHCDDTHGVDSTLLWYTLRWYTTVMIHYCFDTLLWWYTTVMIHALMLNGDDMLHLHQSSCLMQMRCFISTPRRSKRATYDDTHSVLLLCDDTHSSYYVMTFFGGNTPRRSKRATSMSRVPSTHIERP